ncbi:hypothetical protein BKA67DRAFT_373964 [Truncatella angustata]|uniref:Uncharacterized protein n=1 Tax=Truncatella angustata TaxID=152316 RepID=A0A9P8UF96_9PEZI|nr:uncharacterized protein BKA67DRAFT_373964 [Truncatella angustata]KAH6648829.1 hypothetical protein BKA67DRAFT_373964 [Truncatella angustata]
MRPCGAHGCNYARLEGGQRCAKQICTATPDCPGYRMFPISTLCNAHKCNAVDYPSQRRMIESAIPLGTLFAMDPTSTAAQLALCYSPYCAKHTCAQSDCNDRPYKDSRFCASHTCQYKGCSNGSRGKDYCADDVVDHGEYCKDHTCEARDCIEEAATRGKYKGRSRRHEDQSDSEEDSEDDWNDWPGLGFSGGGAYGGGRSRRGGGRRRQTAVGFPPVNYSYEPILSIVETDKRQAPFGLAW